ncbi:unnamed protein product, partial [Gongylonema pulchrum]|uniref:Uncharacterized protein n=1 Tax=Gongylonema pulchrum TaxID=637853 RepID=A0A183EN96_9BILA
ASCENCQNIREHYIRKQRVFVRKVIRKEELRKAEQIERVRAAREARIQEEFEEEEERRKRLLYRKWCENYKAGLASLRSQSSSWRPPVQPSGPVLHQQPLWRPPRQQLPPLRVPSPPPPPPPRAPSASSSSLITTAEEAQPSGSNWVPLLPDNDDSEELQEDASILAGYGPRRKRPKEQLLEQQKRVDGVNRPVSVRAARGGAALMRVWIGKTVIFFEFWVFISAYHYLESSANTSKSSHWIPLPRASAHEPSRIVRHH